MIHSFLKKYLLHLGNYFNTQLSDNTVGAKEIFTPYKSSSREHIYKSNV